MYILFCLGPIILVTVQLAVSRVLFSIRVAAIIIECQSCCFDRKHSFSRFILRQRANATEDFDVDSVHVVHVLISHLLMGGIIWVVTEFRE